MTIDDALLNAMETWVNQNYRLIFAQHPGDTEPHFYYADQRISHEQIRNIVEAFLNAQNRMFTPFEVETLAIELAKRVEGSSIA